MPAVCVGSAQITDGQFDLLRHLYRRVHIAQEDWEEPNARGQYWTGRDEVAEADWLERHTVQNQALVTAPRHDLDKGEGETIALALELGADSVLLDERAGRHAAPRLELRLVGVVGVLLEAKSRSAVDAIHPHLDAPRHKAGFYLSEQVYNSALSLTGESDT